MEIFVDRALARTAELDDNLINTGKVVRPLHGLPISLKDQLCIKGLETTNDPLDQTNCNSVIMIIGYVSWIGQYTEKCSVGWHSDRVRSRPVCPYKCSADNYGEQALKPEMDTPG